MSIPQWNILTRFPTWVAPKGQCNTILSRFNALAVPNHSWVFRPCLFSNSLCIPLAMFSCSFIHSLAGNCLVNSKARRNYVVTCRFLGKKIKYCRLMCRKNFFLRDRWRTLHNPVLKHYFDKKGYVSRSDGGIGSTYLQNSIRFLIAYLRSYQSDLFRVSLIRLLQNRRIPQKTK